MPGGLNVEGELFSHSILRLIVFGVVQLQNSLYHLLEYRSSNVSKRHLSSALGEIPFQHGLDYF